MNAESQHESPRRALFWTEAGLALASCVFVLLTLLWKDWIELTFGVDPDHGSGSLEWLIALGFVGIAVAFAALARRERRRAAAGLRL